MAPGLAAAASLLRCQGAPPPAAAPALAGPRPAAPPAPPLLPPPLPPLHVNPTMAAKSSVASRLRCCLMRAASWSSVNGEGAELAVLPLVAPLATPAPLASSAVLLASAGPLAPPCPSTTAGASVGPSAMQRSAPSPWLPCGTPYRSPTACTAARCRGVSAGGKMSCTSSCTAAAWCSAGPLAAAAGDAAAGLLAAPLLTVALLAAFLAFDALGMAQMSAETRLSSGTKSAGGHQRIMWAQRLLIRSTRQIGRAHV